MTLTRQIKTASGMVHIRTLNSLEEMYPLIDLQRQIWGFGKVGSDPPCPVRTMFALSESGGHLAAAFLNDLAIGFSVAWMGQLKEYNEPYLHSQMLGVLKEYRHLSIGYNLKLYQRSFAIKNGVKLIKWTFDPLRTANSNLNVRKLGSIISTYHCDYYGNVASHFTQELPTDRVWAEWHVDSKMVKDRLCLSFQPMEQKPDLIQVNKVRSEEKLKLTVKFMEYDLEQSEKQLLVEVPSDFDAICHEDRSMALDWRKKIRKILQHYFNQGYVVSDFLVISGLPRQTFYLLNKDPLNKILEASNSYLMGTD